MMIMNTFSVSHALCPWSFVDPFLLFPTIKFLNRFHIHEKYFSLVQQLLPIETMNTKYILFFYWSSWRIPSRKFNKNNLTRISRLVHINIKSSLHFSWPEQVGNELRVTVQVILGGRADLGVECRVGLACNRRGHMMCEHFACFYFMYALLHCTVGVKKNIIELAPETTSFERTYHFIFSRNDYYFQV